MEFDSLGFETRYEVAPEAELPPAGEPLWFTSPGGRPSSDGVVIRVKPESGLIWIGAFAGRTTSLKGIYGTPRPDTLLVVCRGDGYLVPADRPREYESLSMPIVQVCGATEARLLLFVTFTKVVAYDFDGRRWESERLAWDELEITRIVDGRAEGRAWSSPAQDWASFNLDLETGRHEGGAWS